MDKFPSLITDGFVDGRTVPTDKFPSLITDGFVDGRTVPTVSGATVITDGFAYGLFTEGHVSVGNIFIDRRFP